MMGKNDLERYYVDAINDIASDWRTKFIDSAFQSTDAGVGPKATQDDLKHHKSFIGPKFASALNAHLSANPLSSRGPFVLGKDITYADFVIFQIAHDEDWLGLDTNPRLNELVQAMKARPRLVEYFKSDRYYNYEFSPVPPRLPACYGLIKNFHEDRQESREDVPNLAVLTEAKHTSVDAEADHLWEPLNSLNSYKWRQTCARWGVVPEEMYSAAPGPAAAATALGCTSAAPLLHKSVRMSLKGARRALLFLATPRTCNLDKVYASESNALWSKMAPFSQWPRFDSRFMEIYQDSKLVKRNENLAGTRTEDGLQQKPSRSAISIEEWI
ncbi:glutathione S-transferase [Rhizoctonia solani]|uniref:Glutathione S-transferase n=1 Tax=Rhizoctonia solani TaxID=456999 RepID=A0A8H8P4N4_9AGAM|nr:glutathione S-transferase [Rhizoctonia solani]QRW25459.1 glutathione S-transferase [Rhizoctonia solani]